MELPVIEIPKKNWNYPYSVELVPRWCRMQPEDHKDGLGGCWGISYNKTSLTDDTYCSTCHLHENNNEAK